MALFPSPCPLMLDISPAAPGSTAQQCSTAPALGTMCTPVPSFTLLERGAPSWCSLWEGGKEPREGPGPAGESDEPPWGHWVLRGRAGRSRDAPERKQDPVETPWMLSGTCRREQIVLVTAIFWLSWLITAPAWPDGPLSFVASLPSVRGVWLTGKRLSAPLVPKGGRLKSLKGEESHCIYCPLVLFARIQMPLDAFLHK